VIIAINGFISFGTVINRKVIKKWGGIVGFTMGYGGYGDFTQFREVEP